MLLWFELAHIEQCSHCSSIDNWCPALLAPLSAIRKSSMSLVCLWVPQLLWCISCCSWGEELIKICYTPLHWGHSVIWGQQWRGWYYFPIFSCLTLFATFSSNCIHASVTEAGKRHVFDVFWSGKWRGWIYFGEKMPGEFRDIYKHQGDVSLVSMWLRAILQCKSLLLMAN